MTATLPDRPAKGGTAKSGTVQRLLKSAARQSYDPDVDLDWDAPEVDGLWAMQPERMSLYGTELWEQLTDEQRKELSKHEVASIASVGLWFEIVLMQVLLKDVYRSDPTAPRTHFMLTEIADECRHSTMFGRAIGAHGVPAYGPRSQIRRLAKIFPLIARGAGAYASILIGEEPVDRWQREQMNDERIQPLIRMVSRIHVLEEARHVTFAREELERSVARMGRDRATLPPDRDRAGGVRDDALAGPPRRVRRGRHRPARGPPRSAREPELPRHDRLDGGEGDALPRGAGHGRRRLQPQGLAGVLPAAVNP